MAIPESQLQTWSRPGSTTISSNTYASIKGNLDAKNTPYSRNSYEIFLQGSYGNDTNIRADSDVDVVMMLTSIFRSDLSLLPPEQVEAYKRSCSDTTYRFSDFKSGVISQLQNAYSYHNVQIGNKSVKINASSNRLGADIVVCFQYRYYHYFHSETIQPYDEGIIFPTSAGTEIINYPKAHSKNCTAKHQSTKKGLKLIVRIFKNMRNRLVADGVIADGLAPSYFIEGLLYNIPDDQFMGSYCETFYNCVSWLVKTDRSKFMCPNRIQMLFGDSPTQWKDDKCVQYLTSLIRLWNGW